MPDRPLPFKISESVWKTLAVSFYFLALSHLSGCVPKPTITRPQHYIKQSQEYYRLAVDEYKRLIAEGAGLDRLHFELGRLYYQQGEFERAIEELEKTKQPQAKKILAISHYRLGNFTDALEIFSKNEPTDDEYLYYYGLSCERLNLYGKAQGIYKRITQRPYRGLAGERLDKISQLSGVLHLRDLGAGLQRIIAEAPAAELYPQAGALILLSEENIEVTEEDTSVYEGRFVIKVLNERGKKDFSEVIVGYDSTYEKVELVYAHTIKPDATVMPVGVRHIRDVAKYLNFPLYSNARAFIISMPEITDNAVIDYKIKIHRNQLINKKDFVLSYRLQENEPIVLAKFKLVLPFGKKAQIKFLNEEYNHFGADLRGQVTEDNGRLIYRWQFKDIPQIIPEPAMPRRVEINPAILISTFEGWQAVYDWWRDLSKDKIKTTPQISNKVKQLISGKKTDEEKARAIYNFCAKEIRYVAVGYGQAGYEPHTAEEIFTNKYGDCKDQSVLLVTMLRQAGIDAYLVLIGTREYFDLNEDFPAVLFNHCIAAAEIDNNLIFLDPTSEVCSFADLPISDQQRRVLLFKDEGYEIVNTPSYLSEHNRVRQDIEIKINRQEEVRAKRSTHTYGYYNQVQRYWLVYTQPQLIRQSLQERVQEISLGGELIDYNIENADNLDKNVGLEYNFTGPEYWIGAGSLRILPQLTSWIDTSLIAKEKRDYPIDFGLLESKEINFNITFEPNFRVKYLPEDVLINSPWIDYAAHYRHEGNKIYFSENTKVKQRYVMPREFQRFREFYRDLGKKTKQRIVLEERQ